MIMALVSVAPLAPSLSPLSILLCPSLRFPLFDFYMLLSLTSALLHQASIPFWNEIMWRINLLVVFTLDVATERLSDFT